MQITLNEAEIVDAIQDYVRKQINISDGRDIEVDLKAGRGDNGFSATLDIVKRSADAAPTLAAVESKPKTKDVTAKLVEETADEAPAEAKAKTTKAKPAPEKAVDEVIPDQEDAAPEADAEPAKAGGIFNFANNG